jgi:anaerobic ribonucleoside-triphosphate reductase activating protein
MVAPPADVLSIAMTVPVTEAEGPGKRFALWFQGCPLRCPGCCNPEMLSFDGEHQKPLDEVMTEIAAAMPLGIEGITLLGGEPTAHSSGASRLVRRVRELDLSVMVFTGFTLDELRARHDPHIDDLLTHTDILVDGRYERDLPDSTRRWIGSTNQRIHFLTDRYSADDSRWQESNTLELRFVNGEIILNGFPAKKAMASWKRGTP